MKGLSLEILKYFGIDASQKNIYSYISFMNDSKTEPWPQQSPTEQK